MLNHLGGREPGRFKPVGLLFSPGRAGERYPETQFLNRSCKKCCPAFSLQCSSWWRRFANQFLALVRCIAPPIMEKTTKSKPRIFTLVDLRCSICNSMNRIGKRSCHDL